MHVDRGLPLDPFHEAEHLEVSRTSDRHLGVHEPRPVSSAVHPRVFAVSRVFDCSLGSQSGLHLAFEESRAEYGSQNWPPLHGVSVPSDKTSLTSLWNLHSAENRKG